MGEYEQYLKKFRKRQSSADKKNTTISPKRGSTFGGSSQGTRENNETPPYMRTSQKSIISNQTFFNQKT